MLKKVSRGFQGYQGLRAKCHCEEEQNDVGNLIATGEIGDGQRMR